MPLSDDELRSAMPPLPAGFPTLKQSDPLALRKLAVTRLLLNPEWADCPNRMIALACAVHHNLVGHARFAAAQTLKATQAMVASKLKLFVLGEVSADPEQWSGLNTALVIAHDAKEAESLYDGASNPIEVVFDKPKFLIWAPTPENL